MTTSPSDYDLAVAYRIYPKVSASIPPLFPDDKLKLAEFCLESFKNSLGGLRVKLFVLLNNCPPAYEDIFTRRWAPEDLVLLRYPGVPAGVTIREQARILMEQTDAEFVQFAEDDYFYLPGQMQAVVDFLRQHPDADFASIYESSDLYTADLHNMVFEKRRAGDRVWSSCISSTHSFLARRPSLLECRDFLDRLFVSFDKKPTIPDLAMWMALTKKRIFNPWKFVRWSVTHRWFWAGSTALSWIHCWRQIVFGRRYTLWSPHPSIANHMVAGLEATGVDWPQAFQKQLAKTAPAGSTEAKVARHQGEIGRG